jgi:hypothetical protein
MIELQVKKCNFSLSRLAGLYFSAQEARWKHTLVTDEEEPAQ